MAAVWSKLFSLCLVGLVLPFSPGKITNVAPHLGVPLPKPLELGVGVTEKGGQEASSRSGLALGVAQKTLA